MPTPATAATTPTAAATAATVVVAAVVAAVATAAAAAAPPTTAAAATVAAEAATAAAVTIPEAATTAATAAAAATRGAAATTAEALAAAATTRAAGTRLVFRRVDADGPTVERCAVHRLPCGLTVGSLLVRHESEATRTSRLAVRHNLGLHHYTEAGEGFAQAIVRGIPAQATDKKFSRHSSLLLPTSVHNGWRTRVAADDAS